jgi:hypothetical protein
MNVYGGAAADQWKGELVAISGEKMSVFSFKNCLSYPPRINVILK